MSDNGSFSCVKLDRMATVEIDHLYEFDAPKVFDFASMREDENTIDDDWFGSTFVSSFLIIIQEGIQRLLRREGLMTKLEMILSPQSSHFQFQNHFPNERISSPQS